MSCSTPRRVKLEDGGPDGLSISCVHIGVCFAGKDMVSVAEDKGKDCFYLAIKGFKGFLKTEMEKIAPVNLDKEEMLAFIIA